MSFLNSKRIFQVENGIPWNMGWRAQLTCCECLLTHDEKFEIRMGKDGLPQLWNVATLNEAATARLRRKKR